MLIEGSQHFRFLDIERESRQLAAGMAAQGIHPGDAIAYQLPNWRETVVVFLATARLGAHVVPLVPQLGRRELRGIFRETSPRMIFLNGQTPAGVALQKELTADTTNGTLAIAVRSGNDSGRGATYETLRERATEAPSPKVDPHSVAAVIYTSGSTAAPKGALHIHETLTAEIDSLREAHGLSPADRVLMPSPLGHISGVIHGILTPALLGTSAVLQPRWEAGEALKAIGQHAVTYMIGAPVFLQEMLAHPERAQSDLRSLRLFSCGGAPVARSLLEEARSKLPHLIAKRVYGSSEFPTISTTDASDAGQRGQNSEGKSLRGVTIRITDTAGNDLPAGTEGEVRASGPECFLGYADAALDKEAFDEAGFARTGDLGILDADGYLRISGRLKEIIVRKGENISAREIEEQILASCPEFREVAVVPIPDPTRGEIACACGRYGPGASRLNLAQVVTRLRQDGLATRKLPERLEVIDDFPRLPSGKIDKRRLAQILQDSAPAPLAGSRLRG
jgi:cyclohexanecarboxylate-CoA ligase